MVCYMHSADHPHEIYKYLFRSEQTERYDPDSVLENRYTLAQLQGSLVIRDDAASCFRFFQSPRLFWEWNNSQNIEDRCFHEVIFGVVPQRIKFDLDVPEHVLALIPEDQLQGDEGCPAEFANGMEDYLNDLLGACNTDNKAKMETILHVFINHLLDELHASYYTTDYFYATRNDIIVADSSGMTSKGYKFSYHIIVATVAVLNNEEAKHFTAKLLKSLPASFTEIVDKQVNKRTQNFRITGSHKLETINSANSIRTKTIESNLAKKLGTLYARAEESLITVEPGFKIVQPKLNGGSAGIKPSKETAITQDDLKLILDALPPKVMDGHRFSRSSGGLLIFKRSHPSFCRLCQRIHDKDNTLMVSIIAANGADNLEAPTLWEHCRHAPGSNKYIGEITLSKKYFQQTAGAIDRTQESDNFLSNFIKKINDSLVNVHEPMFTDFELLPSHQKQIYSSSTMRRFERVPTLAIKAQMKMGKTRQLREYLTTYYPVSAEGRIGRALPPILRYISFRQTFSQNIQEHFPDFQLYSSYQGELDANRFPRLIIQVESLHRIPMGVSPEPIDLLILDEVESVLVQFSSGLHKHLNMAFAMFTWLLRTARYVICMDANLSDRTYRTLERMRGGPLHFHWNKYERAKNDSFSFTTNRAIWLTSLLEAIREGNKVVIPTNSLTEAKIIYDLISRDFRDKKLRLYSSESSPSEKAEHLSDVARHWKELDVLIYTPTISAGVSFEEKHFDMLYGYFNEMSCDVETCRQMMGRVRNLRLYEYRICLSGGGGDLPTEIEQLKKMIFYERASLYSTTGLGFQVAVQFDYDPVSGAIHYYETPYFHLWLENMRIENLSKNNFIRRFILQVADSGASLCLLTVSQEEGVAHLKLLHKLSKERLAETECAAIATASEISDDEAENLRKIIRGQDNQGHAVGVEKRLAFEKYSLRETYRWYATEISPEFVRKYHKESVRKVYYNLKRISTGKNILQSLQHIQAQEVEYYEEMMARRTPEAENNDLRHSYVFLKHYLATWLLRLCGFRTICTESRVREEGLYARLVAAHRQVLAQADAIAYEFHIKRPKSIVCPTNSTQKDREMFTTKMLRLLNPIFRMMYGREIKRDSKSYGKKFYLAQTDIGHLFILVKPNTLYQRDTQRTKSAVYDRPSIPCNLDTTPNNMEVFLEDLFYDILEETRQIEH